MCPRSVAFSRNSGDVPELDRVVVAGGSEGAAVRAVGHAPDRGRVPVEDAHFLAGGDVPESDRAIITGGSESAAVRAVRDSHGPVRMPAEREILPVE